MDKLITIFTPTYNRASTIGVLFESLNNQSTKCFEWIIVDDGSDNTDSLVEEFKSKADFPIYYYKPGGERGISRAFNLMITKANGFLVMKVDDDDYLKDYAIEKVVEFEKTISTDKKLYAGVSGLRVYPDGQIIGGEWKMDTNFIDATNFKRSKYGLNGDKAEAYYLDVLKKYGPFPTVEGESYTWESVLWDRIAHAGLKIRWFNEPIYVTEYLPDGATANRIEARIKNFGTYTIWVSEHLQYREIPFFQRLVLSCRYFELVRKKGIKCSEVKEKFDNSKIIAKLGYILSAFTRVIPQRKTVYKK